MMRIVSIALVVLLGSWSVCLAQPPEPQAGVPVKVVVLFSSGVGYFEHFGTVRGEGTTELRFKTNQINDILKSLVLQDLDGGRINTITYPSQDPLEKTLKSFQVDLAGNPSLAELLNQLRGAKVNITVAAERLSGTILGVEKKSRPVDDKGIVEIAVLNLLSDGAIRSIELEDISTIEFQDPQLQEELNKALSAVAQARDQDKKPVVIHFGGEGERRVRLGYVVETPIWKTSYRLIMQGKQDDPAKIQGWAIVENQTDNDWDNVQLSLVSGRPISFVQDLYQPLYIPRPVVQPELYASLRPQTYEGGMGGEARDEVRFAERGRKALAKNAARQEGAAMAPAPAEMLADAAELQQAIDPTASISSIASAAKVGELFQYTVGNVSLPRQKSAMIPIITDSIEVEKLSIYNLQVLARNPLNGARVKNTTDKHLLQGPITVFEANTYAGDARIDNVPPGQERLLSYGIDLQMVVDATKNRQDSTILTGKIVKGVLHLSRRHVFSQDYVAENKSDRDKTLIIEHPFRHGWKLIEPEKPIETTAALYRFKGEVPVGKTTRLTVKEEHVAGEVIAILPADIGQLTFYARSGEIPKDVRDVLAKAIQMKQAMVDTQRQIEQRQQRINEITGEQNRIRENMKTVAQNSQYYNRLLGKLNEQETLLEKLHTEIDDLQKTLDQQRGELENYLANTNVG